MRRARVRVSCFIAIAFTVLAAYASPAHATPLAPGTTVVPSLDTSAAGTLLASEIVSYAIAGSTSGTVAAAVFRNTLGFVDFYYQIFNSGPSGVTRTSDFTFAGWDTFTTGGVFYRTDAPAAVFNADCGVPCNAVPLEASRSSIASDNGAVIGFNFFTSANSSGIIAAGQYSDVLVIKTNSPGFQAGTTGVIDGGGTTVTTYEPAPEPGSMVLLGTGLLGLAAVMRRRQQNARS